MPFSTYGSSSIQLPFLPTLDHSKGQWFMPGEELPPGFVATSHPDGHLTPLPEHAMSRKARESMGLDEPNFGMADEKPEKYTTSSGKLTAKDGQKRCCDKAFARRLVQAMRRQAASNAVEDLKDVKF
eukprot:Skav209379  [mRNA]  locus=scaffold5200:3245:6738:+ [translate_table: standard]